MSNAFTTSTGSGAIDRGGVSETPHPPMKRHFIPMDSLLARAEFEVGTPDGLDLWRRNEFGHLYRNQVRLYYRAKVFRFLRDYGLSSPEIAALVGTNHSSVLVSLRSLADGRIQKPAGHRHEDLARTAVLA